MKIVHEPRASTILYNLLVKRTDKRPLLLPANICPIVPITFLKAAAPFQLVDISADTLNMDLETAFAQLESGKSGGVLYAHTYGESSTPEDFFAQAKSLDPTLLVIDDRCLSDPQTEAQQTKADVVLFSTGYGKVVDLGSGGYGFLNQTVDYSQEHLKFKESETEALERDYKSAIATRARYQYRDSDWLQTDGQLPTWDEYKLQVEQGFAEADEHRRSLNAIYAEKLPAEIQLAENYQGWRFNILVQEPQRVSQAIFEARLFASSHYASLGGIFSDERNFPQAEKLASQVVNLFNDYHYSAEMAEKTCEVILGCL